MCRKPSLQAHDRGDVLVVAHGHALFVVLDLVHNKEVRRLTRFNCKPFGLELLRGPIGAISAQDHLLVERQKVQRDLLVKIRLGGRAVLRIVMIVIRSPPR